MNLSQCLPVIAKVINASSLPFHAFSPEAVNSDGEAVVFDLPSLWNGKKIKKIFKRPFRSNPLFARHLQTGGNRNLIFSSQGLTTPVRPISDNTYREPAQKVLLATRRKAWDRIHR